MKLAITENVTSDIFYLFASKTILTKKKYLPLSSSMHRDTKHRTRWESWKIVCLPLQMENKNSNHATVALPLNHFDDPNDE